jgi:hypothetical protein
MFVAPAKRCRLIAGQRCHDLWGGAGTDLGQVPDPLGNRDERACSVRDRAHRRGRHDDQAMTDTATLARIDQPAQDLSQAWGEHDRIG